MRKLNRAAATVAALSTPLLFGISGTAGADGTYFDQSGSTATPKGASSFGTESGSTPYGGAHFSQVGNVATLDGATAFNTESGASPDGEAYFGQGGSMATPKGATAFNTESGASPDGEAYFGQGGSMATPKGATAFNTESGASPDGEAYFGQAGSVASADGATSFNTESGSMPATKGSSEDGGWGKKHGRGGSGDQNLSLDQAQHSLTAQSHEAYQRVVQVQHNLINLGGQATGLLQGSDSTTNQSEDQDAGQQENNY